MRPEPDVHIELSHVTDVRRARSELRLLLGSLSTDGFGMDALLATSELVSNAMEHASVPCSMSAWFSPPWSTVRIEVADARAGSHLVAAMPGPELLHGRGLGIVERVSDRWGVRSTAPTTGTHRTSGGSGSTSPARGDAAAHHGGRVRDGSSGDGSGKIVWFEIDR